MSGEKALQLSSLGTHVTTNPPPSYLFLLLRSLDHFAKLMLSVFPHVMAAFALAFEEQRFHRWAVSFADFFCAT